MENKDLLDDNLDWDAEMGDWTEEPETEPTPVTMLQTFNTEQEAYVAVALLEGEGIMGRVVSSITGGMTPFAYGNVRLFVAASQAEEAAKILRKMTGQDNVKAQSGVSATQILTIIVIGLFIISLIFALLQSVFNH
jgi:Putative prokaryotic signal transducing protein